MNPPPITGFTHLVLVALMMGPALLHAETRRPNIIVIFTDDHGWADFGAQGIREDIRTPNLDLLAAGGLRASNGYVTAPQCVPSRAGLLSGRYQNRFGLESNEQFQQPGGLAGFDASLTIAERLRAAGYATGMAGKWHLGPSERITEHGFDRVFFKHSNAAGFWNMDLDGLDVPPRRQQGGGYHLDAIADFTCAFIRRYAQQPFFFYVACRAPHTPLDAPPKYTSRFPGDMPERRRQALAMVSAVDDGVGRIMATLREQGLEEHTLIFFMGDNGAPLKIHMIDSPLNGDAGGWDGSLNSPLNGEKGMLSEGGIRVPWLAYWKGHIPAGRVFEHPVISLDVAATAVALAGLEAQPRELDGVNLVPYFTGENEAPPHDALYWRWIAQAAVREGRWKLLVGGHRSYLFDLAEDREERRNLLTQHPDVAARLRAKLEAWGRQLQPPGIATRPMAATWERYYDHYLDGRPAPPPTAGSATRRAGESWVARNARAEIRDGVLRVVAKHQGQRAPFVAFSGLKIAGPATAKVQLRIAQAGRVGVAWRLDGQKDFPPGQTSVHQVDVASEFQTVTLNLPSDGKIIHLRLLLPDGTSEVRSLELTSSRGGKPKRLTFQANE